MKIPNDWTECEMYKGHCIAIRGGFYASFLYGKPTTRGNRNTREEVRRDIDALNPSRG